MSIPLVRDYLSPKSGTSRALGFGSKSYRAHGENDGGSILVIDKDGRQYGIFTERDLLHRYLNTLSKFLYLSLDQVKTSPVLGVTTDLPLEEALSLLAQRNIRHLPASDNDSSVLDCLTWKYLFSHFHVAMKGTKFFWSE